MHDYFSGTQGSLPAPSYGGQPAPQPYSAPVGPHPTSAWPPGPPVQSAGMDSGTKRLVLGVLALVGLVAASFAGVRVAGVVHAKREAAHTTVVLPAQVAGLSRAEDPAWAQSLLDAFKESPVEMGTPVLGFYGDGTTFLVVAAGAHYLSQGDQKDFMRGARSGLGGSGLGGMTFRDAPSGGHGRMTCAVAAGRGATMCLWADNGSYGVVVVGGGLQGVSHAVQARETVVRRP